MDNLKLQEKQALEEKVALAEKKFYTKKNGVTAKNWEVAQEELRWFIQKNTPKTEYQKNLENQQLRTLENIARTVGLSF